jgi:putative cardiolipin synthase
MRLSRLIRSVRLLRSVGLRLAAAATLAGCAVLPDRPPLPPEAALPADAGTALARIAAASLPAAPAGPSGFRLLFDGKPSFNARIALIRRAERSVDLQVYHLGADETGRGLLRELRDAAARGVRVRLLVDDLYAGSHAALLAGLAAPPNAQVRLFNPLPARSGTLAQRMLGSLHEFGRVNRRMHNKLLVADGSFAIFGGRNVGDEYFMHDPRANFLDLDVLAAGPVVAELAAVFDGFWNSPHAHPAQALVEPAAAPADARAAFDAAVQDGVTRLGERQRDWFGQPGLLGQLAAGRVSLVGGSAWVWADAPDKGRAGSAAGPTVAARTLALLASAREQALVMTPYFIPGRDGVRVLQTLTADGRVSVQLLTNSLGATDEPLAYAGYERYRLDLLRAGVRIFELSPTLARDSGRVAYFGATTGRLHTKAVAIDGRRLFVGSLNLDPRSAFVNTELGVVIDSPALAQQFASVFRRSVASSAFKLQLAGGGSRIEWVAVDWQGRETLHPDEPHDDPWLRLKLRLLQPFVPEELL